MERMPCSFCCGVTFDFCECIQGKNVMFFSQKWGEIPTKWKSECVCFSHSPFLLLLTATRTVISSAFVVCAHLYSASFVSCSEQGNEAQAVWTGVLKALETREVSCPTQLLLLFSVWFEGTLWVLKLRVCNGSVRLWYNSVGKQRDCSLSSGHLILRPSPRTRLFTEMALLAGFSHWDEWQQI